MDNLTAGVLGILGGVVVGVVGSKLLSNPDRLVYVDASSAGCDEARKALNDRGINTGVCGTVPSKAGPVITLWAPASQVDTADQIVDAYVHNRTLPPVTRGIAGRLGRVPLRNP